jgi:hypothetical protein
MLVKDLLDVYKQSDFVLSQIESNNYENDIDEQDSNYEEIVYNYDVEIPKDKYITDFKIHNIGKFDKVLKTIEFFGIKNYKILDNIMDYFNNNLKICYEYFENLLHNECIYTLRKKGIVNLKGDHLEEMQKYVIDEFLSQNIGENDLEKFMYIFKIGRFFPFNPKSYSYLMYLNKVNKENLILYLNSETNDDEKINNFNMLLLDNIIGDKMLVKIKTIGFLIEDINNTSNLSLSIILGVDKEYEELEELLDNNNFDISSIGLKFNIALNENSIKTYYNIYTKDEIDVEKYAKFIEMVKKIQYISEFDKEFTYILKQQLGNLNFCLKYTFEFGLEFQIYTLNDDDHYLLTDFNKLLFFNDVIFNFNYIINKSQEDITENVTDIIENMGLI